MIHYILSILIVLSSAHYTPKKEVQEFKRKPTKAELLGTINTIDVD